MMEPLSALPTSEKAVGIWKGETTYHAGARLEFTRVIIKLHDIVCNDLFENINFVWFTLPRRNLLICAHDYTQIGKHVSFIR